MRAFHVLRLVCFGLLAVTAACRMKPNTERPEERYVEVDNQGYADMTVFVVEGTRRLKIGLATGASKTKLMLPRSLSRGTRVLRFEMDPVGGNRQSYTQDLTVAPGQNILLTIRP